MSGGEAAQQNGENKMEKKNRIEIVNRIKIVKELASNVEVIFKPYGTWVVKSKALGIAVSFSTHDEDWWLGKYNPSLYNKENVLLDKEVENDAANDDNYEPKELRDLRAAEALFDIWVDDEKVQEDEEGNFCIA